MVGVILMNSKTREHWIKTFSEISLFTSKELQAMSDDQLDKVVEDYYEVYNSAYYAN